MAKKGLGRGLSALIPDGEMDMMSAIARSDSLNKSTQKGPRATTSARSGRVSSAAKPGADTPDEVTSLMNLTQLVDVGLIEANPFQPRRHFAPEEMEDLVESIREHGILQPILIRPTAAGSITDSSKKFQLIAGERRWRAAQLAGLAQVPAVIREVNDQQALELAVIENVQRHDISPLEAALAYRRLADEFHLSQEEIARRVGKSRSGVANTIRLLDLPAEVQKALEDGVISEGHGRAILLAPSEGSRRAVFRRIMRDKLSVREAEQIARSANDVVSTTDEAKSKDTTNTPEAIVRIQESLQKALGTRVKLQTRAKGGRLQIEYYSNEDLSRLIELLLRAKN